jgi:S-adenosylmethionine/arginine decarboxylase-like enzyme
VIEHKHLILIGEARHALTDPAAAKMALERLVEKIGMRLLEGDTNPVAMYCDKPGNRGITATALIETSNITIHCWDEGSPVRVQLDVYSCAPFSVGDVIAWLDNLMGLKAANYSLFDRGYNLRKVLEGTFTR